MNLFKKLLPKNLVEKVRPPYHFLLAWLAAVFYRFPSRKIKVVAVTGTKGKTTVSELVNAVLEAEGLRTALSNTIRRKIGRRTEKNFLRMTMPGRFFLQRFLRQAVRSGCQYAVIEMTSEGARQFRHRFIELDSLIWTNLSPEHIESHGSYENYLKAKLRIAEALSRSRKPRRILVINRDDPEAPKFSAVKNTEQVFYSFNDLSDLKLEKAGSAFRWRGREIKTRLIGRFNVYNLLAALSLATALNLDLEKAAQALAKIEKIPGRAEKVADVGFEVYVDYAHTPDSLEKFYQTFGGRRKICVLGNAGGGRDKWKRPVMGAIANRHCQQVILTNEDPYDEQPEKIVEEMAASVAKEKLKIILDRRLAIRQALRSAKQLVADGEPVVVLITGKGTEPFVTGPAGVKIPWDDPAVVKEELNNV